MKHIVIEKITKGYNQDHIIKYVYVGRELVGTIYEHEYSNFEELDAIIGNLINK